MCIHWYFPGKGSSRADWARSVRGTVGIQLRAYWQLACRSERSRTYSQTKLGFISDHLLSLDPAHGGWWLCPLYSPRKVNVNISRRINCDNTWMDKYFAKLYLLTPHVERAGESGDANARFSQYLRHSFSRYQEYIPSCLLGSQASLFYPTCFHSVVDWVGVGMRGSGLSISAEPEIKLVKPWTFHQSRRATVTIHVPAFICCIWAVGAGRVWHN